MKEDPVSSETGPVHPQVSLKCTSNVLQTSKLSLLTTVTSITGDPGPFHNF